MSKVDYWIDLGGWSWVGYEEIIEKTKKYSDLVINYLHPKMIILYGSYAKGIAREESDIDTF